MNLLSIAMKLGGAALKSIPGVGAVTEILGFVNDILPKNKKLTKESTGKDLQSAIDSLPAEKQTEILSKQFDVELAEIKAHVDIITALADVDKTGNSTRPAIALEQSKLIGFGVIIVLAPIGYAIVTKDHAMIKAVADIWPLILAVIGVPAGIVNSYFGKRFKEKSQKYEAVSKTPPVTGAISQIIGMFKK